MAPLQDSIFVGFDLEHSPSLVRLISGIHYVQQGGIDDNHPAARGSSMDTLRAIHARMRRGDLSEEQ